jgi:hypothetical protein
MPGITQRSLAGGELAPALAARADQAKYQSGLKTCRNMMVMRHGGVTNRAGTGQVAELKTSALKGRLAKFVFNADQTYVLVFQNICMRVIQNGAQLEASPGVPYEIATPYLTADLPTLKFSQSGDVVTITHRNYEVRELSRTGHTSWTLSILSTAPSQAAPTGVTNDGAVGGANAWVVTAVAAETFEESLASVSTTTADGLPRTISWAAAAGASEYNVYRQRSGIFGYVGTSTSTSFADNVTNPDTTITPPQARTPFVGVGNYPATSSYWQQRHMFANTYTNTEKVWGSKSANFRNFSISSPLQDDDAVTFTLAGNQVQPVQHMLSLGDFIILTESGEWNIKGDSDGVLRPNAINARQEGYTGASSVAPVIITNSAIYIQARGSLVRDLRYDLTSNGYSGRDLSVFSAHLFENNTITAMDFQQVPNSIVWLIRDDGTLLGLTYLREHEIWGWHRHDTDGVYEDVCCVPEGVEDAVYVIVKRTINGVTKRFIERFYSRKVTDIAIDARFIDCGLTYDGRNVGATTMTVSGGTEWEHDEDLIINASAGFFVAGDVGNMMVLNSGADSISLVVTSYTSTTQVHANPIRTVPASLRAVAVTNWAKAVDSLTGLSHLEGKSVAILGDGNVVANGVDAPTFSVTGGTLTLSRPYVIIHVGLPYLSDIETLDLDPASGPASQRPNPKLVRSVTLDVQDTRGIWAGPDFDNLLEAKQRDNADWGVPVTAKTGKIDVGVSSTWDDNGRVCVRQKDPLPITILAVTPKTEIGEQDGR